MKHSPGFIGAALLALAVSATSANAQDSFPDKPLTLVVGFSAGGGMDTLGRIIADAAGKILGQQIAVENRPGAGGTISGAHVANAEPDGYTLWLTETAALTGPVVFGEAVGYDPLESFAPVAQLAVAPLAIFANSELPAADIASFVELVRGSPGEYFYAAPGVATLQHMAMEQLKEAAGLEIDAVQFQGGSPSVAAVVSGEVSVGITSLSAAMQQAEGGNVKVLGVTTGEPVAGFEDVPTVGSVVAGFESVPRQFVLAPSGTPDEVVAIVADAFGQALADDAVRQQLVDRGLIPAYLGTQELAAELPGITEVWSQTAERLVEK